MFAHNPLRIRKFKQLVVGKVEEKVKYYLSIEMAFSFMKFEDKFKFEKN